MRPDEGARAERTKPPATPGVDDGSSAAPPAGVEQVIERFEARYVANLRALSEDLIQRVEAAEREQAAPAALRRERDEATREPAPPTAAPHPTQRAPGATPPTAAPDAAAPTASGAAGAQPGGPDRSTGRVDAPMASDAAAAAQRFPRLPTPPAPPGDPWPHPADPAGDVTPQPAPAAPAAPARATWTSPRPTAAAPSPTPPAPRRRDGLRATWDNARYALWVRPALLALIVLLALAIGLGTYLLLQQPH